MWGKQRPPSYVICAGDDRRTGRTAATYPWKGQRPLAQGVERVVLVTGRLLVRWPAPSSRVQRSHPERDALTLTALSVWGCVNERQKSSVKCLSVFCCTPASPRCSVFWLCGLTAFLYLELMMMIIKVVIVMTTFSREITGFLFLHSIIKQWVFFYRPPFGNFTVS